jgi:hypothetical protein
MVVCTGHAAICLQYHASVAAAGIDAARLLKQMALSTLVFTVLFGVGQVLGRPSHICLGDAERTSLISACRGLTKLPR